MPKEKTAQYSSPPILRAMAVLNFLAGHPEQAFTLTEIAKSLKISSATCHNLLTALTEGGYLYRTVGKSYVLGPALASVARASLAPATVMQVVRPEMRQLADEFDLVCSTFYFEAGESVIRERAASLSHVNWNAPYLLSTPVGSLMGRFLAEWDDGVLERWRTEGDPPPTKERVDRARAAIRFLREKGFTFGVRTVPLISAEHARSLQNQASLTESEMPGIDPDEIYQLAYVVAPVFGAGGALTFGLSLAGFTEPVKGAKVTELGGRLREAADRIGAFIAGRQLG